MWTWQRVVEWVQQTSGFAQNTDIAKAIELHRLDGLTLSSICRAELATRVGDVGQVEGIRWCANV